MELYGQDRAEALLVNIYRYCSRNCPGCYLRPHFDRIVGNSYHHYGLSNFEKVLLDSSVKFNQVVLAVSGANELRMLTDRFVDAELMGRLAGLGSQVQILASLNDWLEAGEEKLLDLGKLPIQLACSVDADKTAGESGRLAENEGTILRLFNVINVRVTQRTLPVMRNILDVPFSGVVHLVLDKPILSEHMTNVQKVLAPQLLGLYNHEARHDRRLALDYCLDHVTSEPQTGCRAGVNMFSIHPDGAITGCPYSSRILAQLDPGQDLGEGIRGIRSDANSGAYHDWVHCKIREEVTWRKK